MPWQRFIKSLTFIQENINAVAFLSVFLLLIIWQPEVTPFVRFNYEMAFSWVALVSISFWMASRFNLWIGLFMLLATWSASFPVNSQFSNKAQMLLFQGVLMVWIGTRILNNDRIRSWALNIICIITLVHVYYLVCQWLFGFHPSEAVPIKYKFQPLDASPAVGIVSNYNEAAALLAIGSMAFFRPFWKWFLIPIIILFAAPHSFGGPLTFVIGSITGYYLVKPKIRNIKYHPLWMMYLLVVVGTGLSIYWMLIDPPDFGWRLNTWKLGISELSKDRWLFGCGIGHWKVVMLREDFARWITGQNFYWMSHAHNEYVQALVQMGVFSIVLFVGFILETSLRITRRHPLPVMAFVTMLSYAFIYHIFHNGIIAGVCILWLSLLLGTIKPSQLLIQKR